LRSGRYSLFRRSSCHSCNCTRVTTGALRVTTAIREALIRMKVSRYSRDLRRKHLHNHHWGRDSDSSDHPCSLVSEFQAPADHTQPAAEQLAWGFRQGPGRRCFPGPWDCIPPNATSSYCTLPYHPLRSFESRQRFRRYRPLERRRCSRLHHRLRETGMWSLEL
jgi:hypothetical protein